jgi:hypothetical protein
MLVLFHSLKWKRPYLSLHHVWPVITHFHNQTVDVDDVTVPNVLHQIVYGDECAGPSNTSTKSKD